MRQKSVQSLHCNELVCPEVFAERFSHENRMSAKVVFLLICVTTERIRLCGGR